MLNMGRNSGSMIDRQPSEKNDNVIRFVFQWRRTLLIELAKTFEILNSN